MICEHCGKQTEIAGITKIQNLMGSNLVRRQIIIDIILEYFGYRDIEPLKEKNNVRPLPTHRQILFTFLKMKTNLSFKEVGRILNRDHTTVIHAISTIDDLLFSDPDVRHDVNEINRLLSIF